MKNERFWCGCEKRDSDLFNYYLGHEMKTDVSFVNSVKKVEICHRTNKYKLFNLTKI